MATMVQGLFGLTPEQTQAQQESLMQDRALKYSQMSPFERANYGIYTGVSQLGSGIAQAMGYESPEVKAAKERRGLLMGSDITDVASLRQAAQKAWNGGQQEVAMALMKQAQDLEAEQAQTKLRQAQATYWENKPTSGTAGSGKQAAWKEAVDFIATIQAKQAAGEKIDPADLNKASMYAGYLAKNQAFKMADGSINVIDKNDFGAVQEALKQGAVPVQPQEAVTTSATSPSPVTQTTSASGAPSTAKVGARVIETPQSEAAKAQQIEAKNMVVQRLQDGVTNIDTALNTLGSLTTNPWVQGFAKNFPTDARTLQNAVSAINSTKTIDLITQMKQQSKTGATGFGSVTEKELDLLQSDIVKLDPQSKTIKDDLQRVRTRWNELIGKIQSSGGTMPSSPKAPSQDNEAIIQRVMAAPQNAGKTRAQIEAALKARGIIR